MGMIGAQGLVAVESPWLVYYTDDLGYVAQPDYSGYRRR